MVRGALYSCATFLAGLLLLSLIAPATSASTVTVMNARLGGTGSLSAAVYNGTHFFVFRDHYGQPAGVNDIQVDRYDPVRDVRTTLNVTIAGNLSSAAWAGQSALVLVRGGEPPNANACAPLQPYECWRFMGFTPGNSAVHAFSYSPVRLTPGATVFWDGTFAYAVAKSNSSGPYYSHAIMRFDPALDRWATMPYALWGDIEYGATVWSGSKAYTLGMQNYQGPVGVIDVTDPTARSAGSAPNGGLHVAARSATWMAGRAYVFTDQTVYVYDPGVGSYNDRSVLPQSVVQGGSAAFRSGCESYIFGAHNSNTSYTGILRYSSWNATTRNCNTFGFNGNSTRGNGTGAGGGGSNGGPGANGGPRSSYAICNGNCSADDDGDGITNGNDNCPTTANPNQGDLDGDTYGDACDPTPYSSGWGNSTGSNATQNDPAQEGNATQDDGNATAAPARTTAPAANQEPEGNGTASDNATAPQSSGSARPPPTTAPMPVAGLLIMGLVLAVRKARRGLL